MALDNPIDPRNVTAPHILDTAPIIPQAQQRVANPREQKIYIGALSILGKETPTNYDKLVKLMNEHHLEPERLEGVLRFRRELLERAGGHEAEIAKIDKALGKLEHIDDTALDKAQARAELKTIKEGRNIDEIGVQGGTEKKEKMKSLAGKVALFALGALMIGIGIGLLASPVAPAGIPFLIGGIGVLALGFMSDKSKKELSQMPNRPGANQPPRVEEEDDTTEMEGGRLPQAGHPQNL